MSPASKSLGTALCWTALWVCLDQTTKRVALEFLDEYSHKEIIQGFLSFSLTFNPGGAFGIFSTYSETFRNALFLISALVALGVTMGWIFLTKRQDHLTLLGVGTILGGALGNGLDRFYFGAVVDFIDIHVNGYHWPTFNVADVAITLGALILFVPAFTPKHKEAPACTQKS
jgi:signal peptidase II